MTRRKPAEPPPSRGVSEGPVEVTTRFERFPATIKGAFVLRSADPDPHAAKVLRAEVVRIPTGPTKPVPMTDTQVEVAPRRDLFLPFEVTIADLAASWYVIRSEVQVDAGRSWTHTSRPFSVAWPRSAVRTATVAVNKGFRLDGHPISVERVELKGDRVEVVWREDGAAGTVFELMVTPGAQPLEPLPAGAASHEPPGTGRRRLAFYPAPKVAASLTLSLASPSGAVRTIRLPLT